MQAIWKGAIIAQSDDTVVVEGNHYFPLSSVNTEYLLPSDTHSHCPWKGEASYYSLRVGDEVNLDAVWYYPDPKPEAAHVAGRVAFSGEVDIL